MTIDSSIFKAYDIRGIYPQQINEENYPTIIKAIYTFLLKDIGKESLTISLGRDMRLSGPSLFEVAKKTLVEMGATVVDIGLASTPTFYYSIVKYGYDAGIQISASHNPKEYTGIKFAKNVNDKLVKIGKLTGMEDIKKMAVEEVFVEPKLGGKVIKNEIVLEEEINDALAVFGNMTFKKFKLALDPANAMGCVFLKALFDKIPADLVKLNFTLDGTFPSHEANPYVYKNLKGLQEAVIENKVDLGIATDGDGDRVIFTDEKGQIIQPTSITSLITHMILKKNRGEKIIADIRDIRNVREVCKREGGQFMMSIVGHAYITDQLNRENAAFAGESSGHYFFRQTGGGESSIRVILYVLAAMTEENRPISEIIAEYVTSAELEETNFVISPPAQPPVILQTIEADYSDGTVSKADGLSVEYPDWRFNIRTSNTENEPILRVNVEGTTKALVDNKFATLKEKILSMGGKLKE